MAYAVRGKGKVIARKRRHQRVRQKVSGTAERPRLVVTRSNRHMFAQVVNDDEGKTLVWASTMEPEMRADEAKPVDKAHKVGELIAQRAKEAGIEEVVFDRGGNAYHGRVAAVAEGAREGGLKL